MVPDMSNDATIKDIKEMESVNDKLRLFLFFSMSIRAAIMLPLHDEFRPVHLHQDVCTRRSSE
jgi:hypothetical protein